MLTIHSYNDGEFDSSVPSGEPETPEPPPIEEDLQLTSRAPGSESAVSEAARQRGTPAARSQRAAERAGATSGEGGGEGAASSRAAVHDEDVTVSELFGEDDEEGDGALSSPLTHALAPNSQTQT